MIIFIIVAVVVGLFIFFALRDANAKKKENNRIIASGISAPGKITSIEEIKNSHGNEWVRTIKVNLEVQPEAGATFQSSAIIDNIKVSEIANYAPGAQVELKYDPNDTKKSVIKNPISSQV